MNIKTLRNLGIGCLSIFYLAACTFDNTSETNKDLPDCSLPEINRLSGRDLEKIPDGIVNAVAICNEDILALELMSFYADKEWTIIDRNTFDKGNSRERYNLVLWNTAIVPNEGHVLVDECLRDEDCKDYVGSITLHRVNFDKKSGLRGKDELISEFEIRDSLPTNLRVESDTLSRIVEDLNSGKLFFYRNNRVEEYQYKQGEKS